MAKAVEIITKFVVEYHTYDKKLESRWHYNLDKFKNGPILVEEFDLQPQEKKRVAKKK